MEHPIKINKSATALFLAVILWVLYSYGGFGDIHQTLDQLSEHLGSIAQLLFFLLGAMTIVEVVSIHNGFKVVTDLIRTSRKRTLLWIISFITFFLSSVLDNMTTTIVIVTLLSKLLSDKNDRLIFASMVIIAANAGGAWTPIGDVTTTMLWIGGQITTVNIMQMLIVPSLVCLVLPLVYQSLLIKGTFKSPEGNEAMSKTEPGAKLIFWMGILGLIFVPVFKATTGLPPYLGMLCSLSVIWLVSEIIHRGKKDHQHLLINRALTKIDVPSVLFFLGILLAVSCLETSGILHEFATYLDEKVGNKDVIITIIGLLSAVIDNIPLTAACQGMYTLASPEHNPDAYNFALSNPDLVSHGAFMFNNVQYFLHDAKIWEMLAFAVGTGGSCLIIGSAAGVVAMGIEKIEFIWYMKKIAITAMIGYFGGIFAYLLQYYLMH
ncbi:MAG: sodium:proton antiporter NhaD [Bacteroidetes bacterium]|nr:sodium:proton antiporter NhaD [Bacteroidota bacterium]